MILINWLKKILGLERKPYIVACRKIEPAQRDVYRSHATGYMDIYGGGDKTPLGKKVYYKVDLTPQGVKEFESASNLLYIEEDREVHALHHLSGKDVSAQAPPVNGVEDFALNYQQQFDVGKAGYSGEGVVVYVLDTGVDVNKLPDYLKASNLAIWNWFNDDGVDRNGHGTWCVGAAVAFKSRWVSIKVLGDNGSGSTSGIVGAIRQATDHAVAIGKRGVISLSLGSGGTSRAMDEAIHYARSKGVLSVCASGNENAQAPGTPANGPSAIAVGAIDQRNNQRAGFSNRLAHKANMGVCAPGVGVLGCGGRMSGTSMATPMAARAIACLLSTGKTVDAVEKALYSGCELRGGTRHDLGWGIVQAFNSLNTLLGDVPPPPPPAPTPTPTPTPKPPKKTVAVEVIYDDGSKERFGKSA